MTSTPDSPFDPLAEWLGIPPHEQPPDHYRLLGLKLFEDRAETIERAADERMAALRRHQSGPRAAATQQVLNRLAAAKQCLLNPATRSAYDAAIRGQLAANESATRPAARPGPLDKPLAIAIESPPVNAALDLGIGAAARRADASGAREPEPGRTPAAPRRSAHRPLALLCIALSIFTACAGAWVLFGPGRKSSQPAPPVVVKRRAADNPAERADAPTLVRPEDGVLRCTAENVKREDAGRRSGEELDMTLVDGRVELSWTARVTKAGFYAPSVTYSAAGEAAQSFEIEMHDGALRTTPIRPTAGEFATDELKTVVFRKTGDHRVVLRAVGKSDPKRTIKLRRLEFRPVGSSQSAAAADAP